MNINNFLLLYIQTILKHFIYHQPNIYKKLLEENIVQIFPCSRQTEVR